MWKLAFASLMALVSPLTQDFGPTTYVTHPYIERMMCDRGMGTAFKLRDGRWVTAFHVAVLGNCQIDGKPISVTYADSYKDIATFTVDDNRRGGIEPNCAGFIDRSWYHGIGHGRGSPYPEAKAVRHSAFYTFIAGDRWAVLDANRFVPGMSGGPVLDGTGRAVGIVNAYGKDLRISFSLQLRDSPICQ